MIFLKDKYGFWRQSDPELFKYDEKYKAMQKTTEAMAWLRLGFLFSVVCPNECRSFLACDVGSGNGCFARIASKCFSSVKEYDVSGDSITRNEFEHTEWDMIFLTDVLEHFNSIDDLFALHFKYVFLSFPETPAVDDWKDLKEWRHFKPNEHIYCLNEKGIVQWLKTHGYEVIACGNPEDAIRKPQIGLNRNISTVIAKRQ